MPLIHRAMPLINWPEAVMKLVAGSNAVGFAKHHRFRINGEVKEIDCEVGSGVCDCDGNEIFEGDTVNYHDCNWKVRFYRSQFDFGAKERPLADFDEADMQIIPHPKND